jgi:hypothetical protein
VSDGQRIAFSTLAFPDASLATALSPLVRIFAGPLPGHEPARTARLEAAARALEASVPAAARLGVAIRVETHDAFSASSVLAELLALVDAPWVGAVWDSHHPHRMGERLAEVCANIGPRVLLAQVKDAIRGLNVTPTGGSCSSARVKCGCRKCSACSPVVATRGGFRSSGRSGAPKEIEEPEVALPQHLRLLES